MSGELFKRIAFAVVAAPLAVWIVWLGGLPLALLLAVVSALGAWELFRMARGGGIDPLDALGVPLAAALPLFTHFQKLGTFDNPALGRGDYPGFELSLTSASALGAVAILVVLTTAIWTRGVAGRPLTSVAVTVFGVLYTGGMLSFGYLLRYHDYVVGPASGTAMVGLPMVLTWASDIGAYFVGRALGKKKLIPSVSPGKTVAGAVGALFVTAFASWAYVRWVLHVHAMLGLVAFGSALAGAVLFGLLVSVAAQVGDLAESLLKREANVKDSSRLLPGHGGILDRFDSLLFVLPLSYLLLGALLVPAHR